MIKEAIRKVVEGEDLSEAEARGAMEAIMGGEATPAQIAAFITALRMKGETIEEITGCAKVMREKAARIEVKGELVDVDRDEVDVDRETILDTCGTGGDGTHTFNVSTATAFVCAGGGLLVAKHGNRSVSSQCGSADVLKELGLNLEIAPDRVADCIHKVGIGFLFAPAFHSAMKYAIGPRREVGIRTIFNILGPLTNPAGADVQVLGVYRKELTKPLAHVLKRLGTRAAFVVHGEGTYDEISIVGPTAVSELSGGKVRSYTITPEEFGLNKAEAEAIEGGDAAENAAIIRDIMKGTKGAKRDMVLLNAAAAFKAAGKAADLAGGIPLAEESIDSGRAGKALDDLIEMSNRV